MAVADCSILQGGKTPFMVCYGQSVNEADNQLNSSSFAYVRVVEHQQSWYVRAANFESSVR